MNHRIVIRDKGRRSDPETTAILQRELARWEASKPVAPPAVIAYNKAMREWRDAGEALRLNIRRSSTKRYEVLEEYGAVTIPGLGTTMSHRVIGYADTKTEADALKRNARR